MISGARAVRFMPFFRKTHFASHRFAPAILAGALAAATSGVQAARPMATEDATLLDANTCQLETWVQRNRSSTEFWAQPACNIGGRVEVAIGGARIREPSETRYSTVLVQAKTLLRTHDEQRPGWGLLLGTERSRALHRNSIGNPYLSVITTVPLRGEAVLLHANAGWTRERDDFERTRRSHATWALALDTEVAEHTRLSAEIFGQSRERPQIQLGLRRALVPGRVQLDGSIGTRLGSGSQDRYFTIGVVFYTPELF
jgi:hypothetical protein